MDVEINRAVFNAVYLPHLENMARTQIFYGGSSSGKSVFLAQRCVMDILKGGRNYLITRQVGRTIRGSVFQEVVRVIIGWGLLGLFTINKSDMVITCQNGYQVLFAGLDDVEKLKSLVPAKGVLTDVWIEEATEADRNTVKQLYKRQRGGSKDTPKRLTMSFNPILQSHWIYQDYFATIAWADSQASYNSDDLSIQKTWYVNNRFLTDEDIRDLEKETDSYFYQVYTLGNWGVLGNVIFTNWSVADLSGMREQFTNLRVGLDFGFSSDPAAVVVSHYDTSRKVIYVFGELYERGLTNNILAEEARKIAGDEPITCDSAEPKSIAELRGYGVNAISARKGKDSVIHGVQWLQQQKIIVDSSCINMRNEFQQYHWREDKDGNAIRQPTDKNNHLIDALRYAYEMDAAGGAVTAMPNPFYD